MFIKKWIQGSSSIAIYVGIKVDNWNHWLHFFSDLGVVLSIISCSIYVSRKRSFAGNRLVSELGRLEPVALHHAKVSFRDRCRIPHPHPRVRPRFGQVRSIPGESGAPDCFAWDSWHPHSLTDPKVRSRGSVSGRRAGGTKKIRSESSA